MQPSTYAGEVYDNSLSCCCIRFIHVHACILVTLHAEIVWRLINAVSGIWFEEMVTNVFILKLRTKTAVGIIPSKTISEQVSINFGFTHCFHLVIKVSMWLQWLYLARSMSACLATASPGSAFRYNSSHLFSYTLCPLVDATVQAASDVRHGHALLRRAVHQGVGAADSAQRGCRLLHSAARAALLPVVLVRRAQPAGNAHDARGRGGRQPHQPHAAAVSAS